MIPAGAAELLRFIRRAETGEDDQNEQYRKIIRHKETELPKPVTAYTIDELLAAQVGWGKKWKSSAAGAYQIIRKTLAGLKTSLKLSGNEKFSPDLQDRLGFALLQGRGWDKYAAGKLSRDAFATEIAKEWASMPVLKAMKGANRQIARGQSYYAGDGLNKSLVTPEEFEAVLDKARKQKAGPEPREPIRDAFPEKGARNDRIVAKVQADLRALGYSEVGAVDGDFGPATEAAIMVFRRDNGLPLNGRIDNELLATLVKAKPRKISTERAEAPPAVVHGQAPEAKASWVSKISSAAMGWFSAIGAGLTWLIGNFSDARNAVKPIADFFGGIPIWAYASLIALGFFTVWWMSRKAEHKTIEAYQAGERR